MTVSVPTLASTEWKSLRARRAFVSAEPRPVLRDRGRWRTGAWLSMGLVAVALGLGFAVLPEPDHSAAPPPPPASPAPAVIWTEVAHPFVAYDLAGGPYAKLPLRYAARRNHAGGTREDTLTYGSAEPGYPFLKVSFLRRGDSEETVETSVFLDAVRLAAGANLAVTRSGLGAHLDTRFGPFEVAAIAVENSGRSADCLAFRLTDSASASVVAIRGLACGTVEHPADPTTLACTIDRLDLVSAGDDEALRAVFVAAERRRREGCATRQSGPIRLGASEAAQIRGTLRGAI